MASKTSYRDHWESREFPTVEDANADTSARQTSMRPSPWGPRALVTDDIWAGLEADDDELAQHWSHWDRDEDGEEVWVVNHQRHQATVEPVLSGDHSQAGAPMTTDSPVQPRRAALEMAEASDIGLPQTAWPDLATPSTSGFDYLQENTADQIAHHDGDVHLERLTIAPAERVSPESVERVLESLSRSSAVTSLRESLPQDSRVAQVRQWTSNHLRLILSVLAIGVVVSVWTFISSRPQTHTVINESSSASPFQAGGENPESNQGRTGTTPAGVSTAPNPSSPPPPVQVRVHVLGAVANPGVVTLPQGSRVDDAIVAAGGLTASADPKDLNLAAIVEDGNQVIIGTTANPRGELVRAGQAPASGGDAPLPSVIQINLNTASQAQLETLPGVGPVLAAEIITYRSGTPFSAVSELRNVKGIGNKLYERLAPLVTV